MELVCTVVPIKEINLVLKTPVLLRGAELEGRLYLSARQNSPGDISPGWTSLGIILWGRFGGVLQLAFP